VARIRERKTDAERKASGSWRPSNSSEAQDRRIAENIYAGPGYQDVPDPEMPLAGVGQKKYFELCGKLLEQGKLTYTTRATAEQVAILTEAQHQRLVCGQRIPVYLTRDISRFMALLKLSEEVAPIGGNVSIVPKENPFDPCGSLLVAFTPERLRGSSPATPGSRAS
jgi:hypothetical protein